MGLEAPIVEVSEKRRARRRTTGARVGVRPLGKQRVETRLLDISRYGFRVAAERLTPGSSVWLKLADSEPQLARVVWSDQYASRCVFLEPLAQVIYRPALPTPGTAPPITPSPSFHKRNPPRTPRVLRLPFPPPPAPPRHPPPPHAS